MKNHKIALLIPSTINVFEPAAAELIALWIKRAKFVFAEHFGGFTSHEAFGGWMTAQGLVEEPVTIVSSFTDENGLDHLDEVRLLAEEMAMALSQEAVAIEIDSQMEFISPLEVAA
ncbi:hypothetical protein [Planctomicrobium sp. SH527]|uniref:hypothetical protein n=1 Tax=Planctomicrobium sp. SH527 TaxID=3448123 RepID=UPI003F5BF4C4